MLMRLSRFQRVSLWVQVAIPFSLYVTGHAFASSKLMKDACAKASQPGFSTGAGDELPYFCALPERVKKKVPEVYWWPQERYQTWLVSLHPKPASLNFGKDPKDSHQKANAMILDPKACHFFSSISPSVQRKAVDLKDPRTKIVLDDDDLLAQCQGLSKEFKRSGAPLCSVIEFAGHSTQSVGLDTVLGIDEQQGKKIVIPSPKRVREIGQCLRNISAKGAAVFFSTCGGDLAYSKDGGPRQTYFWPGKEAAQKELTQLLKMPVISGIGFVDGTPEGGVTCDEGWHLSEF